MICIKKVVLREVVLDLKEPFQISSGTITQRRVFVVEVENSDGIIAHSECVAKGMPNYSPETIDTAWIILRDWIIPQVLDKAFESPQSLIDHINSTVRGNNMAKAAIEMAAWLIIAIQKNVSLASLIGGTREKIETGVSLGIQESPDELVHKVKRSINEGYRKIKIKIKPGYDVQYLTAVRAECPDACIMADANSAYTLNDIALLQSFDELNLLMIEQPLEWDDVSKHSQLINQLKTPVCLDESITSYSQALAAIHCKSADIINIKPGRVSGFTDSLAINKLCEEHNIPVWCGGMLESGIGRAYNVALASLANFSLPGDLSPSQRYWKEDIVSPEWEMDKEGYMSVPFDKVGLGVSVKTDMIKEQAVRTEVCETIKVI